jgi:predicted MPP superfamily phosphohydrolase
MKLIWLTDIHINFLNVKERNHFYQKIIDLNGEAILITGDIAEASSVAELLKEMVKKIKKTIYFVLGNHDYYGRKISEVRIEMKDLTKKEDLLNWLPVCGPQLLEKDTILVGQDGWADGRYGDYANSRVNLNDSRMIVDFFEKKIIGKYPLLEKMQQFADSDAEKLKDNLYQAINLYQPKKIIVLTHVPPFQESCMHEGQISDNNWLPYFTSKATGDVLFAVAENNSTIIFQVLCGHTHSHAYYQPLENLIVKTGRAEYRYPQVQEVIYLGRFC